MDSGLFSGTLGFVHYLVCDGDSDQSLANLLETKTSMAYFCH
jgi:hypothetical protein